MTTDPDPRTAADDDEDATATPAAPNQGVSAAEPAEGTDDTPGDRSGSARG